MAVRGLGFTRLTRLRDALELFTREASLGPVGVERVSPLDSYLRVVASEVRAPVDVPAASRAAMDGYAVRARDTFAASPDAPVRLKLVGRVMTGEEPGVRVGAGEAVEVSTGAFIPEGADAVVRYEDSREEKGYVYVYAPVTPWENVNRAGSDVKRGDVVLRPGHLIRAPDVAMLYTLGVREVPVYVKPRVAVITVGSELVRGPGPAPLGKVVDSNRPMVALMVRECLCEPVDMGLYGDDVEEVSKALREAAEGAHAIITIGGLSVGKVDLTPDALKRAGARILVHGVAIKPGRPTALSVLNGRPVISLPGPPAATLIAFYAVARPILLRMAGLRGDPLPRVKAVLSSRIPSKLGVRDYVRVRLMRGDDGVLRAVLVKVGGAGLLSTLVKADGLVEVPEDREGLLEGEEVEVTLIGGLLGHV